MAAIRPPDTVKPMTENGRPSMVLTSPAAPLTSAGCVAAAVAIRRKVSSCPATAAAPRIVRSPPVSAPPSARSVTSGSRRATSPSKSPPRAAARKASTTRRWPERSGSGGGVAPRTLSRARLASFLAAWGVRSTIGAISSNDSPNMSCSTNASRSAGLSESSTTSSASPTESATSA